MKDLRVALIQSDLYWESPAANLAMFEEKIWEIDGEVDLIVLPEMFTTGFSVKATHLAEVANTNTFRWMRQQAQQTSACIMGSYIVREGTSYYNRLYCVHPDGNNQFYDKKHLFGLAGEGDAFSRGSEQKIFEIKGWKIRAMICYDLRFPVWSRSRSTDDDPYEYDLLVYVANWPKPRINAWDTLLAARAIENISFALVVNMLGLDGVDAEYIGHSAVYDFKGDQLAFSDEEETIVASLSHSDLVEFRNKFPFQHDADGFKLE